MTHLRSLQTLFGGLRLGAQHLVCLTILFLTLASKAQEFTYTVSEGGEATITSYFGSATAITLPTSIDGFPVRSIGDDAFQFNSTLTSVVIPSGIVSIGERAFNECPGLTSTNIPNSVTSIGRDAFYGCIGLTSVTIGSGVTSLGTGVFAACSNLASITVAVANLSFSSLDGVLFDELKTALIQYPPKKSGNYVIPNTVTSIGPYAFQGCVTGFTSVTLPSNLTSIGFFAFEGCSLLTTVAIPNSVQTIGSAAFRNCAAITTISIGSGTTSIEDSAFYGCYALTALAVDPLNSSYSSLDGVLFDKIQTILIQYPARKAGRYLVPEGVLTIQRDAFDTAINLTSVNLPGSLTEIGDAAFYGCSALTSIVIPSSITQILEYTFAECTRLTSVTIGNSVTEIGQYAFSGCIRVTGATFGTLLAHIGNNAFENCTILSRATFFGNAPTLGVNAFATVAAGFTVVYPTSSSGFTTPLWNGFASAPSSLAPPEISLEQPAMTPLSSGISTVAFASTLVNSTTINTFTLKNLGSDVLRDIVASKDGPNAAEFTVSSVVTFVNGGANTTFTVTFQPAAAGTRSAVLHLSSNDLDENPFVIALTGQGIGSGIAIEQLPNNTPVLDASSTVSYGNSDLSTPKPISFTVRNPGTANLTNLVITKSGLQSAEFTVGALGSTTVIPGGSTTFTISFSPAAVGIRNAAISIASNALGTVNPYTFNLTGTGIAPEIAVEQENGSNLADNAVAVSHGSTLVGTQLFKTYTIRNSGAGNLNGLAITKTGTHSADFTVTASPTAPVATGGFTTLTVRFSPSAIGVRTAAIQIANNDTDENPFDINLSGTGTAPDISVEQGTVLVDGTSIVAYGASNITSAVARTFTVRNPGSANLFDLVATIDGVNSSDFMVTTSPNSPVLPAGFTTFVVTFNPTALGIRSANLRITSNVVGAKNPFDISLTGTGVSPEISVEQPTNTLLIDGESTSSFASTLVNATTIHTFTLRNLGSSALSGIAIVKDGLNASDFTVSAVATAINSGLSTTFTVTFRPSAVGLRTAAIHISSNDLNENPFDILLSGTGIQPDIALEQLPNNTPLVDGVGTVSYGITPLSTPQPISLTIRNPGTANLTGLVITKSGTNSSDFTVGALGATTVTPGNTTTFTISFSPSAVGVRSAAISIASNAPGTLNPFTLNLTGIGNAPEMAVELENGSGLADAAVSVSHGTTLVGTELFRTYTIRNSGEGNLTGLTFTKTGTHNADFTVTASPSAPVTTGNFTTLTVRFSPSAVGLRTAAIQILNNDANENPYDINLSGTGIAPDISVEQGTALADGTSTIAYGSSNVATGLARTFTVRNPGSANLFGLIATVEGANPADFTVTTAPVSPVLPAGFTTFVVTFNPTALGARTATLRIASNVVGTKNPFDVFLTGTGISPEISVEQPINTILTDSVSTSVFAPTVVNATVVNTFAIRNLGTSVLSGISITKDGEHAADFTVSAVAAAINSGLGTTFTVTFKPSSVGMRTAAIRIISNDLNENPFDIQLSGMGVAPDIALELLPNNTPLIDGVSTVPWDIVPVNTSKVLSFAVRNSGTSSLTGLSITKSGTNNAEFTVSALGATTLAAGASTTFTISFRPAAVGVRTAAISIASNVVGTKNPFTINLNGGVSSDARLAGLAINAGVLAPLFSSDTLQYTASVDSSTATLSLTPTILAAGGTVRVNGTLVASGTPSAAIPLIIGANTINTLVTAPDGVTTRTYSLIVTKIDPYGSWATSHGLGAGNSAKFDNPDHDGSVNLHEYAFATDPLSGQSGSLILNGNTIIQHGTPISQTSPGPIYSGVFIRRSDYLAAGLIYKPQFSSNMVDWIDANEVPVVIATNGIVEAVSVPHPANRNFFRVSVSLP